MLGWRKLSAWFLVFVLIVASTLLSRDIPDNAADTLKWITMAFFGANAAKPVFTMITDKVKSG